MRVSEFGGTKSARLWNHLMRLLDRYMTIERCICFQHSHYVAAFHRLSAAYPQVDYAGFASLREALAAHKLTGQSCQPPAWSNTVRQASLKLERLRRRQAVMARTLGISPAQSR